jgi:hypothetical protein
MLESLNLYSNGLQDEWLGFNYQKISGMNFSFYRCVLASFEQSGLSSKLVTHLHLVPSLENMKPHNYAIYITSWYDAWAQE